jgi:hypothetical protein
MIMRRIASVVGLVLSSALSASAAVLANWDFTGEPGTQAVTVVDTTDASITASDISRGIGLVVQDTGANSMNARGWTTAASRDADDYYQFAVTLSGAGTMTITNVSLAERRSGTGIRTWALLSSLDSYATPIATVGVPDDTNIRDQSIPLSTGFDNLTGTVTFRLYGYAAEAATGTWRLQNNTTSGGLTVSGYVEVPEPASLASIAAGVALLLLRRRRARVA